MECRTAVPGAAAPPAEEEPFPRDDEQHQQQQQQREEIGAQRTSAALPPPLPEQPPPPQEEMQPPEEAAAPVEDNSPDEEGAAIEDAREGENAQQEASAPSVPLALPLHHPAALLWGGSMSGDRADRLSAFLDRPKFTVVGEERRRARSVLLEEIPRTGAEETARLSHGLSSRLEQRPAT